MTYTPLAKRLHNRTGLSFTSDGVLVPNYQLASTRSLKASIAAQDIEALNKALQDLRVEIDTVNTKLSFEPATAAIFKYELSNLKEEYAIIYNTHKTYSYLKNKL